MLRSWLDVRLLRRTTTPWVALVCLLLLGACQAGSDSVEPAAATVAPLEIADDGGATIDAAIGRLGQTQSVSLTITGTRRLELDGTRGEALADPQVQVDAQIVTTATSGGLETTAVVSRLAGAEGAVDGLGLLPSATGTTFTFGRTSVGTVTTSTITQTPPLSLAEQSRLAEVGDALSLALPTMPDRPIGPGARWSVGHLRSEGSRRWLGRATYEVVSLDGPMMTIDFTLEEAITSDTGDGDPPADERLVQSTDGSREISGRFTIAVADAMVTSLEADLESELIEWRDGVRLGTSILVSTVVISSEGLVGQG